MLAFFKKKPVTAIGIDISSTSISTLELSVTQTQYCIKNYGRCTLPPDVIKSNSIRDVNALADAIKMLVANTYMTSKNVVIAVPDSSAIRKIIQIDSCLKDADIEEWVLIEAQKFIPYPSDEIDIDFQLMGSSNNRTGLLDCFVVASRRENVRLRVEAIRLAGLVAKIVDVESYAIERTLQFLTRDLSCLERKKNIAILDLGKTYSRYLIFNETNIIFTHEGTWSGMALIDAMGAVYCYSAAVLPFFESLLSQTRRALHYFFSTTHHTAIDQIILAGEMAQIPGLVTYISRHLGIASTIANPFNHMVFSNTVNQESIEQDAPMLMTLCGLAIRAAQYHDQ